MIFDEDILEERYDLRTLPQMVPSHHFTLSDKRNQNGDECDTESQTLSYGKQILQSQFKIDTCHSSQQRQTEPCNTNITEFEENSPFENMIYYFNNPAFSFRKNRDNNNSDHQDSKQVEVFESTNQKYAQGVPSMRVNQNILPNIHLISSQTFNNCAYCSDKCERDNHFERGVNLNQKRDSQFNVKRNSSSNPDSLLDKLRIRTSSHVNQDPLQTIQTKQILNNSKHSNYFKTCECTCRLRQYSQFNYNNRNNNNNDNNDNNNNNNNNSYRNYSHSSGSNKPSKVNLNYLRKFHSSIIDGSKFENSEQIHMKDNGLNAADRCIMSGNESLYQPFSINYHHRVGRARSLIQIIDNPEMRKKWVLARIIQMSFDAQLTHTLIESIDYFNLTKEQILDQMIDKLQEFKKYRLQQQLEGSLIQPQISHSEYLKSKSNFKEQKQSYRNEALSLRHQQRQSQFQNRSSNNQNKYEDMSLSLSKVQENPRGRRSIQYYQNRQLISTPPVFDSLQISQGIGRSQIDSGVEDIVKLPHPNYPISSSISPTLQKQIPKYNFSQIRLTYSNQIFSPMKDHNKAKRKSYNIQQKFKQDTKKGICSICFEYQLLIQISINCSHYFCYYCISNYFDDKIVKCDVLEINCLNFQCKNKYLEIEIREILDPSTFQQYLKFVRLIMIRQDQSLRWCIKPECTGVLKGSTLNQKMQCQLCQTYQCYICSGVWHEGIRCDQAINVEYEKEQIELRKNCPKCLKEVKKSKSKDITNNQARECEQKYLPSMWASFLLVMQQKSNTISFQYMEFLWLSSQKHFLNATGMININQIPSYYQKMKYKLKAFFQYIVQILIFSILLLLYPIVMLVVSFFLPLLIFFNKNGGTIRYRGSKKCLVVSGLMAIGILLYPFWYIISIVPGLCWFCNKLMQYLSNQRDNSKNQESDDDNIDDDLEILSQQVTKGICESGFTKPN